MARRCTEVLSWPADGFAKGLGSVEGPVRIAEHCARQQDEVGFFFGNDFVGLLRVGDHADGGGGDGGFSADACSEGSLIARTDGNGGMGYEAAGRAIDEVDAVGAEMAGESN